MAGWSREVILLERGGDVSKLSTLVEFTLSALASPAVTGAPQGGPRGGASECPPSDPVSSSFPTGKLSHPQRQASRKPC